MTTNSTQKLMQRSTQIVTGSVFFILFATFFFPEFFPWSRRDFSIPTAGVAAREEDRYGVWRTEVRVLLQDTTVFWKAALADEGIDYTAPSLSFLFGKTDDLCGTGIASGAAAYCPFTQEVAVDTGEYQGVSRQVGQRDHLAVAYSFAHQVGHHVQHLRGTLEPHAGEELGAHARRIEMQADCYAGIWLHSTQGRFGEFDFYDIYAIQTQFSPRHDAQPGKRVPGALLETRDYADAQQRTNWIRKGFRSRDIKECDGSLAGSSQK